MLKRILCALVALSALLSCCVSLAEQRPLAIPCPASLGDPEHQQVTAELYSAVVQGTGYTDELALDLHWPESASVRTDYQMILEPVENDGQKAVYRYRGDIIRRAFDENGELTQENWENREARGEAVFSLEEDERVVLRLTDEIAKELKACGFKYLGTVTIYSHLQACGLVNDHGKDCPCYQRINDANPTIRKRRYLEKSRYMN